MKRCGRGHILTEGNLYHRPDGRSQCLTCLRRGSREYARRKRKTNGRHIGARVSAAPFTDWLREHSPDDPQEMRAWAIANDIDPMTVRRLKSGQHKFVHIDVVDRVFTARGECWLLEELYPLEEVAA